MPTPPLSIDPSVRECGVSSPPSLSKVSETQMADLPSEEQLPEEEAAETRQRDQDNARTFRVTLQAENQARNVSAAYVAFPSGQGYLSQA